MKPAWLFVFAVSALAIGGCPPPTEIVNDDQPTDAGDMLPDLPDDELFDIVFNDVSNPEEVDIFADDASDALDLDTAAFDFGTVDVARPMLTVTDANGNPVSSASVRVISGTPDAPVGELLFRGQTNSAGQSQLDLTLLRSQPESTIIVEKPFFETNTIVFDATTNATELELTLDLDVVQPDVPEDIDEIFGTDDSGRGAPIISKQSAREKTGTQQTMTTARMDLPLSLLDEVVGLFPERNPLPQRRPQFLADEVNPNLELTEETTVSVTFIDEGAGYRNAFGYFLYDDAGNVISYQPVWENASELGGGGDLVPGDTVTLGTFPAGTNIGFYVIANGFSRGHSLPTQTSRRYVFHSRDELNRRNDRHVAMIVANTIVDDARPIVVGWEDLPISSGDQDYNDLVYLINLSSPTAVQTLIDQGLPQSDVVTDTDGDGVIDSEDDFPEDEDRAFRVRVPAEGRNFMVAFEDNFPQVGDGDYNDVIVSFYANRITNASGRIKDLDFTHLIVARGASFEHELHHRVRFSDAVPVQATTKTFDQSWTEIETTTTDYEGTADMLIFANTHDALVDTETSSNLPNTEPGAAQVRGAYTQTTLTFTPSFPVTAVEPLPADPYLYVIDTGFDIHLIGQEPVAGSKNPPASGNNTFLNDNGFPFALLVPNNWRYPEAGVFIENAFPDFAPWRQAGGEAQTDWYDRPDAGSRDYTFEIP